jgi:hypothetical protein
MHLLKLIPLLPFLWIPSLAEEVASPDLKLKAILSAFDKREEAMDSTKAHREWIKTQEGRDEARYLAEHYDSLHDMRKREIPMELARTGDPDVLPLVRKSLADLSSNGSAMSGIFFACHFSKPGEQYRRGLASAVIPWIGKNRIARQDKAIELLPVLDSELASSTLLTDDFLSPDAPLVDIVLASFNSARLEIPLPRIQRLLDAWRESGMNSSSDYRIVRGYREAIRALAAHKPKDAMSMVEDIVRRYPQKSETFSDIPLAAAGLTGLYDALCEHTDNPEDFSKLPEAARIYFAVTYFESDWENGGISQALGNSTGDYLPWVKKGYQEIGDTRGLKFLEFMLKPFGPEGPSVNRETRNLQMEKMKPTYWELEDSLSGTWEKESPINPNLSTEWLLSQFAARNTEVLRPLLKSKK